MQKGKSFCSRETGPASEMHAVYREEDMEASGSDSEPASTCQGSHCETDPGPKPKRTKYRERLVPLCIKQSLTEHGPKPIHLLLE